MSKIYCPSCAKPNLYSFDKPKFCGHCGAGLSVGFTTTAGTTAPVAAPRTSPSHVIRYQSTEPEIVEVPQLESLSYTKSISETRGITLGEVIKQQKTGFERVGSKSFSSEEVLAELKNSAKRTIIEDESLPLTQEEND